MALNGLRAISRPAARITLHHLPGLILLSSLTKFCAADLLVIQLAAQVNRFMECSRISKSHNLFGRVNLEVRIVEVESNMAGVAHKELPSREQWERHKQPPVVLRKLSLHSNDRVAPYRSASHAHDGGQSHDALGHPSHRHAHGGGDMVHLVHMPYGSAWALREFNARITPIIRITLNHLLRFIGFPSGKNLRLGSAD